MNQSDYAARHGVSRKTVTTWKKRGWLVLRGEDVVVEDSDALLAKYRKAGSTPVNPGNASVLPRDEVTEKVTETPNLLPGETTLDAVDRLIAVNGADMTVEEAKRVKENYLAKLAQLDYDIKSGRVVDATAVAEVVGTEYSKVRTKLLAIPAEQAPALKRCRTTAELQDRLSEIIIHNTLTELIEA